jgi:phosphoketolase
VVVVTAAVVEVAAAAVSHKVMEQILKKVLAMSQKIQQRIQRKAQKVRPIAVAAAAVPLVKM